MAEGFILVNVHPGSVGIVALLKYLLGKPSGKGEPEAGPEQKTPLDILKEAYARGEIGRDEYLQKRQDLLEK